MWTDVDPAKLAASVASAAERAIHRAYPDWVHKRYDQCPHCVSDALGLEIVRSTARDIARQLAQQ